ncbi:hypothetical protein [Nitrospirillum viridazoti]|uniref:Uncharacterized protein n=1 Tax=Nitrospirillum amazonense TaxID=28077 RepID=A0A560II74_9PROT|nr:hypothetical protein [Nitrospirillum amazonense]TWB58717.1 hypothetical protein FBZ92_109210 [Nitrospirillum amazonense]
MRAPGDSQTLDLLSWEPPAVVPTFSPEQVRAESLRGQVSRAVAQCLKDAALAGLERKAIAQRMSEYLGESVSPDMLNNYASQAREDQSISALRLSALAHATGDVRPFQILVAPFGHAVIPSRYLPAIEEALVTEQMEKLGRRLKRARRAWRGESA